MSNYITNLKYAPNFPGIYFLYQDYFLVYIGKSDSSIRRRLKEHLKYKSFNSFRFKFVPKGLCRNIEADELRKYKKSQGCLPLYNQQQ